MPSLTEQPALCPRRLGAAVGLVHPTGTDTCMKGHACVRVGQGRCLAWRVALPAPLVPLGTWHGAVHPTPIASLGDQKRQQVLLCGSKGVGGVKEDNATPCARGGEGGGSFCSPRAHAVHLSSTLLHKHPAPAKRNGPPCGPHCRLPLVAAADPARHRHLGTPCRAMCEPSCTPADLPCSGGLCVLLDAHGLCMRSQGRGRGQSWTADVLIPRDPFPLFSCKRSGQPFTPPYTSPSGEAVRQSFPVTEPYSVRCLMQTSKAAASRISSSGRRHRRASNTSNPGPPNRGQSAGRSEGPGTR